MLSFWGYGQNNCFQFTTRPYNIIPNPSFEIDPLQCASGYFDLLGLKIPSWTTGTDMILTGYLNACSNFLIADSTVFKASAVNPFIALYPLVPQPIPDGNGVAVVSDYGFTEGATHVYPKYASYVRTCLPTALEKDSLFRLEFYVGFGTHGTTSLTSKFNVELLPQVSATPEKFSLYGLEYCPAKPDPILGCMAVPGWYVLGSTTVTGTSSSWVKTAINFKSPDNIIALALGPSCDTTYANTQGNFNFSGRNVTTNNYSFFLDNLQLFKSNVPEPMIRIKGSTCDPSVQVALSTAFYFNGFTFQWYKNGVLLPNEQDSFLLVNRNEHGEGIYQCQVQNANVCLLSDSLQVTWKNTPSAFALGSADTLACNGDTVLLNVAGDSSFRFAWQDGSDLSHFSASHAGTYSVNISNECANVEAQKTVHFGKCNYDIYIPNAFTPNGDGHNDVFRLRFEHPPTRCRMTILNRYGQQLFSTSDPSQGWDGSLRGAKQSTGTYIWILDYTDHNQLNQSRRGTVELIR